MGNMCNKSEAIVTVLLIAYNHKNYIEKAINSVLEQKTNFPIKVIIFDDASTDGTSAIVQKYQHLPNVECVIREQNIGSINNIYDGLTRVQTPYYAILETDDYWCDENKLQLQVDALEKHPECSFCAHNTRIHYENGETSSDELYYDFPSSIYTFPPPKISSKYYIEPHMSSRLYRTRCLDLTKLKNKTIAVYDIASNFYFLTKGSLLYLDQVMSVYNWTQKGIYSGSSRLKQHFMSASIIHQINEEFSYKYNNLISRFFSKCLNLNFISYLSLRYTKNTASLKQRYETILEKYKSNYLISKDVKIFCRFCLPLSSHKKIVFEIKREKNLF